MFQPTWRPSSGSIMLAKSSVWLMEVGGRMLRSHNLAYNGTDRYYYFIIGIQPLGRSGQRPELSQATGMAPVRCILGKFLGVVCHCFPPLFRRSHFSPPSASTSATTWEIPAACRHTHHRYKFHAAKHQLRTQNISSNFSEARFNTPWGWIPKDPKHVGVFNCLLK